MHDSSPPSLDFSPPICPQGKCPLSVYMRNELTTIMTNFGVFKSPTKTHQSECVDTIIDGSVIKRVLPLQK